MDALLFFLKVGKLRFLEFGACSLQRAQADMQVCLNSTFSKRMFECQTTRPFIKFKIVGYVLNGLHSTPLFKFIK